MLLTKCEEESGEGVRLTISSAEGGRGLNGSTGLLAFFSCFYVFRCPHPSLPVCHERTKESEVPLTRNKKQQNLFIGGLIEDG